MEKQVKYYYSPLRYYSGKVLKCAGIVTDDNRWVLDENPGTIIVDGYLGDRIREKDHTQVALHVSFDSL